MNCQEARSLVEDALDRTLSGGVKRRLDLHLQHCAECRAFFEAEKAEFVRWYAAVNGVGAHAHALPPDFADRLVAAVTAPRPLPFFLRMPRWALVAASLAIAALGVVFAAVVADKAIFAEAPESEEESAEGDAPQGVPLDGPASNAYARQAPSGDAGQPESRKSAIAISTSKTESQAGAASAPEIENEEGKMNMMKRGSAALAAAAVLGAAPMASAVTYYKIGNDGGGQSSFAGNVDGSIGWATSADATATTSFSATEMAASDFVVNALTLRLPTADDNAVTFGGRSLTLTGNGTLALKKKANGGNRDVTIAALAVSDSGFINHAQASSQFTLKGAISLAADSTLRVGLGTGDNGECRRLVIDSNLTGGETTAINITGGGGATSSASLTLNSAGGFLGTMTSTIDLPNFSLLINGAFGGTITAFPDSTKAVVIDYDGLPAATGLRVASTTIPAALKTKLTLYSATTDFMQDRLPLVTFPAGTDVDPAEFTVKHATSATGAATAFPHLTVVTNADDTVTLAVDGTVPMYAKMVKGEGDVYAWHFYGCGWGDVTATCGLSVPDSTIKVYVTSTEEVAPILANPGTPAGYRIGNLSADADLTSLSPLAIEAGSEIDLNGHALTIPSSVLDALKASTKNLVNNGTFEAEPISDNSYDKAIVITGWTKSANSDNMIGLMRKNTTYLYAQRNDNTTWCYITKDYNISQTVTVPEDTTYLFSLKVANKNYLKSNKQAYDASNGNLQIDGSNVLTWSGGNASTRTISGGIQTLTAGSHTLKISCTSGSGDGIDNVTMSYLPPTATITSSAAGGELHVNVPSDVVMTNSAVNISGHVKFVKEGPGTFVSCRRDLYYNGGNEIVEGKLMTAEGNGSNRDWAPRYRPLGEKAKAITVRKDGILDIAGNYEYGDYPIVLDGGLLRSGTVNDGYIAQATNNNWNGIGRLSLTTNSTFYLRSDTVFRGWDSEQIKLNGHELLFELSVDSKRLYMAKDMTNGTIRLSPADNSKKRAFIIYNRDVDARTVDVIDEIGCISPVTTFSVRSYTATSPSGNSYWSGTGRMYVYGMFTPTTDYFYGCTMMDGSTIDLSGRSGTWSTTGAYNCGRRTVDFADNATIYVKLGHRNGFPANTPVIGWTTRPANLDTLTFKREERGTTMIKLDDGVYLQSGTLVLIR